MAGITTALSKWPMTKTKKRMLLLQPLVSQQHSILHSNHYIGKAVSAGEQDQDRVPSHKTTPHRTLNLQALKSS